MRPSELWKTTGGWVKGAMVEGPDGNGTTHPCKMGPIINGFGPALCTFCLAGIIVYAEQTENISEEQMFALFRALCDLIRDDGEKCNEDTGMLWMRRELVEPWNDASERTYKEVDEMLLKAERMVFDEGK